MTAIIAMTLRITDSPLIARPAIARPFPPYSIGARLALPRAINPIMTPVIAPTPSNPKKRILRMPMISAAIARPFLRFGGGGDPLNPACVANEKPQFKQEDAPIGFTFPHLWQFILLPRL